MIRARLRSWFMTWLLGDDPEAVMAIVRDALETSQAELARALHVAERLDRLEQLARVSLVAVDPLDGARLHPRMDPYLDSCGVMVCTAEDARANAIQPLERVTTDERPPPDKLRFS